MIQLHDKQFGIYLSEQQILKRVAELANQINTDYANRSPIFLSVLKGSFMFTSDLLKKVTVDCRTCFIKISSYVGMQSSGEVTIASGLDMDLSNQDVIVVEDIVDTGRTMHYLLKHLQQQHIASVKVASLLVKPDALQYPNMPLDYIGFNIPSKFVVGYGLDYNELGRQYPDIYQLSTADK